MIHYSRKNTPYVIRSVKCKVTVGCSYLGVIVRFRTWFNYNKAFTSKINCSTFLHGSITHTTKVIEFSINILKLAVNHLYYMTVTLL